MTFLGCQGSRSDGCKMMQNLGLGTLESSMNETSQTILHFFLPSSPPSSLPRKAFAYLWLKLTKEPSSCLSRRVLFIPSSRRVLFSTRPGPLRRPVKGSTARSVGSASSGTRAPLDRIARIAQGCVGIPTIGALLGRLRGCVGDGNFRPERFSQPFALCLLGPPSFGFFSPR